MKFVFDLDGTICFKGKPVSTKILNELERLTRKGHEVIFASARPIRDILPVIHKDFHHYTMIGGNGSLTSIDGEIKNSKAFSPDEISEIMSMISQYEATYLIDGEWDYAYTGPRDHPILQNVDPAKVAKMVQFHSLSLIVKILILTSKDMEHLAKELSKLDVCIHYHGNENVLDISPKGIHKWSALEALHVEKDSYIAFGNDANDISMFENARHTVMVGHHDQLASLAKESIALVGDYEQAIVNKLRELA